MASNFGTLHITLACLNYEILDSKYKFIYISRTLNIVVMFSLMLPLWAGAFGFLLPGVNSSGVFKLLTSASIVYLIWLFFARKIKPEIIINQECISIPNTWLPGIMRHRYKWVDIKNVEYAVFHLQETVCFQMRGNKSKHINIKALKAFHLNRSVAKPSEKLMRYLLTILETDTENNY